LIGIGGEVTLANIGLIIYFKGSFNSLAGLIFDQAVELVEGTIGNDLSVSFNNFRDAEIAAREIIGLNCNFNYLLSTIVQGTLDIIVALSKVNRDRGILALNWSNNLNSVILLSIGA